MASLKPLISSLVNHILLQPNIGLSLAVSIRVGNELGAGNPHGAKKASFVAIVCTRK